MYIYIQNELQSYLIEITSHIFAKEDDMTDSGHVVDFILDKTGMKGTGRWTVQEVSERASLEEDEISGGEEGARNGPSLMPGGPREAFDLVEPMLLKCSAQDADGPCTTYCGPIGAGNYVKMIHNGIEYGDMQLIAEIYDVLKKIIGMKNEEISATFANWNKVRLWTTLARSDRNERHKNTNLSFHVYLYPERASVLLD